MKSKKSLRKQTLLYFFLGIVLPMLLLGGLLIGASIYYVKKDLTRKSNLFVHSLTSQIEKHLEEIESHVRFDMELFSSEIAREGSDEVLDTWSRYHDEYLKVVVTDLSGKVLAVGPVEKEGLGIDVSRYSFFERTLKSEKVVWSTSFQEGTFYTPVVTLSLRLKDRVYICYLDLVDIGKLVAFQNSQLNSRMMLVDQIGTYIVHPDPGKAERRERNIHFEEIKQGYDGKSFSKRIGDSDIFVFGDFISTTGWAILLYVNSEQIYGELNSLVWVLLIILVITISLTSYVIFRHSSYLRNELKKFTGVIKHYEYGDYSTTLEDSRFEEFSLVSDCLNTMAFAVKEREQSIIEQDELIRTIIDGSFALVAYVDTAGVHKYVNENYEAALGSEDCEVWGTSILEICKRKKLGHFKEQFEKSLAGQDTDEEIEIAIQDGERAVTYRSHMTPHWGADSSISGVIIFLLDISKRLQLEKELRQAHKLKAVGTLAGGIAHDFNNILCAILGNAQLLQYKLVDCDERSKKKLDSIVQGCQRAATLVEQILAFSKNAEHSKADIPLTPIVKEVMTLLRASFPATIEIHANLNSNSLVRADQTQIHQVLMNLCTNAKQAMEGSVGTLLIELADVWVNEEFVEELPGMEIGRYVRLSVSDTGCGISAHDQERLFEPFFSTKQKADGTGLGLSVVHGIVESSGGKISVISAKGEGTTFNIYLPVQKTNVLKADDEVLSDIDKLQGEGEIFIVDDESSIVEVLSSMLQLLGYSVRSTNCSVDALTHLRENTKRYDLIITDSSMPKVAGAEVVKSLKEVNASVPIIMTSGFLDKKVEFMIQELGVDAIMTKPYDVEKVGSVIKGLLEISREN